MPLLINFILNIIARHPVLLFHNLYELSPFNNKYEYFYQNNQYSYQSKIHKFFHQKLIF